MCPIIVTVKKDKSVNFAIDSKLLNKFHKKYQTPNIDSLVDSIFHNLNLFYNTAIRYTPPAHLNYNHIRQIFTNFTSFAENQLRQTVWSWFLRVNR